MTDLWTSTFSVAGSCWTSQRGVRRAFALPDLFGISCRTYLDREPPDAKAHLLVTGTRAGRPAGYPAIGFHLDLDPLVEPWTVTRVDLTSLAEDGNTTIGLRMLAPLTWLDAGEQRCPAVSGDFLYDVVSTRTPELWRLQVVPAHGVSAAPWLAALDLELRTSPAGQWPWNGVQLTLRSDAQDIASLNGDFELSLREA